MFFQESKFCLVLAELYFNVFDKRKNIVAK